MNNLSAVAEVKKKKATIARKNRKILKNFSISHHVLTIESFIRIYGVRDVLFFCEREHTHFPTIN
jgi:hypothetical protein